MARQLNAVGNTRCFVLLGGDPGIGDDRDVVLTGPLRDKVCRDAPADPPNAGNNAGGAAGTTAILPRVVTKRLDQARGEEPQQTADGAEGVMELIKGLNLFISGEYESMDRDVTTFEDGYDSDIWRAVAGADYSFTDWLTAGLAFDYYHQDGDFASSGAFDTDSYGVLAFASLTPFDQAFLQLTGGWSRHDYERNRFAFFSDINNDFHALPQVEERLAEGFLGAEYSGDEYRLGLLTGYTFFVQNVRITPRAGLDWVRNSFDTYSESGTTGLELVFYGDDEIALQSTVGVQGSMSINTAIGVLVPQRL